MAGYEALTRMARDEVSGFYEQVQWALTVAVTRIEQEDEETENHATRLRWANQIRQGIFIVPMRQLAELLLEHPTLQAAVIGSDQNPNWIGTDVEVQFVLDSNLSRIIAIR